MNKKDPKKPVCVCRKPTNKRFMIACDKCESRFHGTCVGVNRAKGRDMEEKGLEWFCPGCIRKEYDYTSDGRADYQVLKMRTF